MCRLSQQLLSLSVDGTLMVVVCYPGTPCGLLEARTVIVRNVRTLSLRHISWYARQAGSRARVPTSLSWGTVFAECGILRDTRRGERRYKKGKLLRRLSAVVGLKHRDTHISTQDDEYG